MRSGRGKCPQCREIIVVDLDAPEIRCPFCNALLKKSAKSVAEVRAEKEAQEALAREEAAAAAAAEAAAAEAAAADIPTPVEEAQPEVAAQEEPVAEVAPEAVAEEQPAEAPVEQPDEIGLSDEELAKMDEAPAIDEKEEQAAPDEIGLSDEELAMLDDTPNEALSSEPSAEEAAEEKPLAFGSISAEEAEETPEEKAEEESEAPDTEGAETTVGSNVELADDVDPALLDEDAVVSEEPAEEEAPEAQPIEEAAPAEEPAAEPEQEEIALPEETEAAAEETAESDEIPVEESDEAPVEEQAEAPAIEIEEPEEIPVEEPEEAEAGDAETEEDSEAAGAYTEEDMAFAASLSDSVGTARARSEAGAALARVVKRTDAEKKDKKKDEKKDEKKAKKPEKEKKAKAKETPSKGENAMGERIYKKPIALIMMLLSVLAAAFHFLYIKPATFGLISEDLTAKIIEKVPTFGGANFPMYVICIFCGLIALVSLFGLSGKKGKIGFLFVLLADIVYAVYALFGGAGLPYIDMEALIKIVAEYGKYAEYAIFGLLLLAGIFFAVAMVSGREDYEFSGGMSVLPILYMLAVVLGYAALMILPKVLTSFEVSANMMRYIAIGTIALPLLLTLIGVHSATASRSANGWLIFSALMTISLLFFVGIVVEKIIEGQGGVPDYIVARYFDYLVPVIGYFGVIGFTAADLRN